MPYLPHPVAIERSDGGLLISIGGDLDAATLEPLTAAVVAEIGADDRHVCLDLHAVTFCGSAGLTLLLRVDRQVQASNGALTLHRPSPAVMRVIDATNLRRRFSIQDNEAPASRMQSGAVATSA